MLGSTRLIIAKGPASVSDAATPTTASALLIFFVDSSFISKTVSSLAVSCPALTTSLVAAANLPLPAGRDEFQCRLLRIEADFDAVVGRKQHHGFRALQNENHWIGGSAAVAVPAVLCRMTKLSFE